MVSFIVMPNAALSRGIVASVFGLQFLAADATPSAALEATACRTAAWLSATSLACRTPDGYAAARAVVVTAAACGTKPAGFTFDGAVANKSSCRPGSSALVGCRLRGGPNPEA